MICKNIFHISDIHIYNQTYNNIINSFHILVKHIIEKSIDESVLVLAGDVFEYKSLLYTEDIYIFKEICDILEQKCIKTVIIPGNHDYNINSLDYKDKISPLVKEYKYIRCYNKTSVYSNVFDIDNIDFYIFSPIDKKEIDCIDNGKTRVGICHKSFYNEEYSNGGFVKSNSLDIFKGIDIVLLGDIHKPQFLTKNIGYPGSFVQKNKGEGLNHGYILWDVENKTGKHIFIDLKELYLTLYAENDKCDLYTVKQNQSIKYLTFKYKNCSKEFLKNIEIKIKNKYGNIDKKVQVYDKADLNTKTQEKIFNFNIDHTKYIEQIVDKYGFEQDKKNILQFHNSKMEKIIENFNYNYKLKYLKWDNLYCFGENNYIDFQNFHNNLIVLNAKNKQGKSSILDIIVYTLFNYQLRGDLNNIVNKRCKKGYSEICFIIKNDIYIINVQLIRTEKIKKVTLLKNNVNITKGNINQTYDYIKNVIGIGEYTDFLNTNVAIQNRTFLSDIVGENKLFLNFLTKITKLDNLKQIEEDVKKEKLELSRRSKDLKKELDSEFIIDNNELNTQIEKFEKIKKEKITFEKLIDKYNEILKKNLKKYNEEEYLRLCKIFENNKSFLLQDIDFSIPDYKKINLLNDIKNLEKELQGFIFKENLEIDEELILSKNDIYKSIVILKDKLENITIQNIVYDEKKYKEYKQYVDNNKEITFKKLKDCNLISYNEEEYKLLNLTHTKEELNLYFSSIFEKFKYSQNCKCCIRNNNLVDKYFSSLKLTEKDYNEKKKDYDVFLYNKDVEEHNKNVKNIIDNINQYKKYIESYELFLEDKKLKELEEKLKKIVLYENHKKYLKLQELLTIKTKLELEETNNNYKKYKEFQNIKKIIDDLNLSLHDFKIKLKNLSCSYEEYSKLVAENKLLFSKKNKKIEELESNKKKIDFFEKYITCISEKDGISNIIIKEICKNITIHCNSYLSEITDFVIELDFDKKLNIFIIENDMKIPASMSSGFQKFIMDMILRLSLCNFGNIGIDNFIFIDEGFGTLDQNNFENVCNILLKLKEDDMNIFIITHIEELKSYADKIINIERYNNYSYVNYGENIETIDIKKCEKIEKEDNVKDNSIIEKIIVLKESYSEKFFCKSCNKHFVNNKNAVQRHITAKSYKEKHNLYLNTLDI